MMFDPVINTANLVVNSISYLIKKKEGEVHFCNSYLANGIKYQKYCTQRYSKPTPKNQFTNCLNYVTCDNCWHKMLWDNRITHDQFTEFSNLEVKS